MWAGVMRNPIVISFGTFDQLLPGHLSMLEKAARHGPLIVGVSDNELSRRKHNTYPVNDCLFRMSAVKSLRCVDEVFVEESHELRRNYIKRYRADIMVLSPKWKGRFDSLSHDTCQIIYYL
jgi:cytidyltransferase-like protein